MDIEREVTIIMITFNNFDFTRACVWALRRYYPKMRVILADGGSEATEYFKLMTLGCDVIQVYNGTLHECDNAAAALVRTPFFLTMDNDVKVISPDAIPLMLEPMRTPNVATVVAYAVKVRDWKKRIAWVGTNFTSSVECDAGVRYFQLHRTELFRCIGGFPHRFFYPETPKRFDPYMLKRGCHGDLAISQVYAEHGGWLTVTAPRTVPILHWAHAKQKGEREEYEIWNSSHTTNERLDPFEP
jgi:Glycosyl transferase family 2